MLLLTAREQPKPHSFWENIMAKKNGYSVYSNWLDMPFRFLGHFKNKKAAEDFMKQDRKEKMIHNHLIINEARPVLEVGAEASDWNGFPANYVKPTR